LNPEAQIGLFARIGNFFSTTKQTLSAIDDIRPDGGTNISSGLLLGKELVNKYHKQGYSKRLFLFSDGLANGGVTSQAGLGAIAAGFLKDEVRTTTFGIGSDFDESIMKTVAEKGQSEFYYLKSAGVIQTLVLRGLQGVMNACATKTKLVLRGRNGAIVTKIWGHDVVAAELGDLHSNNSRQVLAEITLSGSTPGPVEVLYYEFSYYLPSDLQKEYKLTGTISVNFSSESIEEQPNAKVKSAHLIQQTGEIDEVVNTHVRNGNVVEALAMQKQTVFLLDEASKLDGGEGMATNLWKMANGLLSKLENKGITEEAKQEYSHQGYMKRRCSFSYTSNYSDM
jgi:hypothetical protein